MYTSERGTVQTREQGAFLKQPSVSLDIRHNSNDGVAFATRPWTINLGIF
jgi:hypothetical protein